MKVNFLALVKEVKVKALISLDKGFEVKLQGEDFAMAELVNAPADNSVKVTIEWEEVEDKDLIEEAPEQLIDKDGNLVK